MSYIVAHCRKVQTAVGLAAVGRHNCREAVYDDQGRALGKLPKYIVHPERAAMNEGDRCGGSIILKNRSKRVQEANLGRKPQKNAAAAVEASISASAEWFEAHKPDEWQKYFRDARKFLADRYGKENVLHWVVHYDEKTPHMHVLFTPIIQTKDGPRYSSSNFLGGRKGLRDLQTEIAATLGDKYGLVRGQEGSNARHTDQYEWIEDTARMRKELERKEKALALRETELKKKEVQFLKIANARLKPFAPTLEKKPRGAFILTFTASDGTKDLSWEQYTAKETILQAQAYAENMLDYSKAFQVKATQYEAAAEELPRVRERLVQTQDAWSKDVATIKNLSPKELRAMADKREADLSKQKERRLDIGW